MQTSERSSTGGILSWLIKSIFGDADDSNSNNNNNTQLSETESLTAGSTLGSFCMQQNIYDNSSNDNSVVQALLPTDTCYSRLSHVQMARRMRDRKDFNTALLHYKTALTAAAELDPNTDTIISDSCIYHEIGQVLYDDNKPNEAIAAFDKGIELMSIADYSLFYRKGVVHSSLAQYDEALDSFQRILEFDPREPSALFQSSLVEQKRQRYSNALKFTERLLEVQPDHYEAEVMCIECLGSLQRNREASTRLDQLAKAYPRRATSLSRLLIHKSPLQMDLHP